MIHDALALRNELIGKAHRGEIELREAEAEAQRLGLGRIASSAPTERFDPMVVERLPLAPGIMIRAAKLSAASSPLHGEGPEIAYPKIVDAI